MSKIALAETHQESASVITGDTIAAEAGLEISSTRHFARWLHEQKASLAFTTYQSGKIFWVGSQSNGELSIFERTFPRPMGLCASSDGQTLYLSTLSQIWRFENALLFGQKVEGYDANYIPQVAYTTGDIDVHDMAIDNQQQLVFVNTLFSCLATVSEQYSFVPLWQPPFISKLPQKTAVT